MANVLECAKYLILEGTKRNFPPITHLKLQKLLYYAQVYSLLRFQKPLFNNDLQAWIHGPVCPEVYDVYHAFKKNDDLAVTVKYLNLGDIKLSSLDKMVLDRIINSYGKLSGDQLEFLTHREQPWRLARGNLKPWEFGDTVITKESILSNYRLVDKA